MNRYVWLYKTVWIFIQILYTNGTNNFIELQQNIHYQPCSTQVNTYIQYYGTNVFKNTGSQTTISDFTLTGWFYFRGYNLEDYNVVSVVEQNNNVYTVYYNISLNKIRVKWLNEITLREIIPYSPIKKNNWYFMKFSIELTTSSNVEFNLVMYDVNDILFYTEYGFTDTTNHKYPFIKNDLIFNFGWTNVITPLACSYTRNIYLYWDTKFSNLDLLTIENDLTALDTYLLWNFDIFYSEKNPGYIISQQIPNQKQQIQITSASEEPLVLNDNNSFFTDYINAKEQEGFVISFHVKLDQNPGTGQIHYLLVLSQIPNSIQVFLLDGNIYLKSTVLVSKSFVSTQWNQLTLIVKQQIKNSASLIINEDKTNLLYINGFSNFPLAQLEFGSTLNLGVKMWLSNIRVYIGAFLVPDNSCKFFAARQIQHCVICSNPNLLDYQNQMKCVANSLPNKSTLINDVKDWYPKQFKCHPDMILDNLTSTCICRFQYYRDGDQCFKCKDYCKGCIDANTCIEQDSKRDIHGQCENGYFDDGYSCLPQVYTILSKKNIKWNLDEPDTGTGTTCTGRTANLPKFIQDKNQLNLSSSSKFFVSFSFSRQPDIFQKSALGYLREGTVDLFSFFYGTTSGHQIIFYYINSSVVQFNFNPNEPVWIGLWSDFTKAKMIVYSNGQFMQKEINVNFSSYSLTNVFLCIGVCKAVNDGSWACGIYSKTSVTFIHQMEYPQDATLVMNLFSQLAKSFTFYQINFFEFVSFTKINNLLAPSTLDLLFNSDVSFERFKGVKLNKDLYGIVQNINIEGYLPTFSCSIFIELITYQIQLLKCQVSTTVQLEYYIVPHGERAFIRICFFNLCKDTKYAMLNIGQQNTLFIITRIRSKLSTDIIIVYFEVICNYQRENIFFYQNNSGYSPVSPTNIYIAFNQSLFNIYKIYLNNILIEKGDTSYYVDEQDVKKEMCFLLRNVYDMECMLPKRNYVFYENAIISETDCIQMAEIKNTLFVVDQSSKQCIDTQLTSLCAQIDSFSEKLICQKCKYIGADLSIGCLCPEGTFLEQSSLACKPCSDICLTCENKANNCLKCKQLNQQPPKCNCKLPYYFLDEINTCSQCSQKCGTCEYEQSNCITCADKRVEPPSCNCGLQYYENNQICEDIPCENKCDGCITSMDNCFKCKKGRVNPPNCECDENHYPIEDGQCIQCPTSNFYDSVSSQCQPCEKPCKQCIGSKNNCVLCEEGFIVKDMQCKCQNGKSFVTISSERFACLEDMDASLKVKLKGNFYYLEFSFDYDLKSIGFHQYKNMSELIHLVFTEIPQNVYSLTNPSISGNKLSFLLNVNQSFQSLNGQILFKQNTPFMSISDRYVLSESYTTNPIQFQIGPFIFDESVLNFGGDAIIDQLQNKNFFLQTFVQESQLLFYFMNTAQPTLLYLFLKVQLPPNLYKFYQVFGLMIFPDVVNYQTGDYKESYTFLSLQLNNTEVHLCKSSIYQKLGFSNSFLINNPVVVLKYLMISILLLIIGLRNAYKGNTISNKKQSVIQFLLKRVNAENETNLLIITISILVQFTENNESSWANRYGYYLSLLFFFLFMLSFVYNIYEVNTRQKRNKNLFSYQFTERITYNMKFMQRNYFLFQMLKKYLVIGILFSFQQLPVYACSICGIIFLVSAIQTVYYKPYKTTLSRTIKIVGEIILSFTWFIHIVLISVENQLLNQTILDSDEVSKYVNIGSIAIISLLVFNILYIIVVIEQIYKFIMSYLRSKKKREERPHIFKLGQISLLTQQNSICKSEKQQLIRNQSIFQKYPKITKSILKNSNK